MRVKLFWQDSRRSLNELYKDGSIKPFSFRNVKGAWKDWWFGKNQHGSPYGGWPEVLSSRKSKDLEDEINAWLSQNSKIKVVDIKQSVGGGGFAPDLWLISVWYEEAA